MNSYTYTKLEGVHKNGGLIINDNDGLGAIVGDLVKQVGNKILEGNVVDMMKISRPARLTAPLTHLTCLGSDFRYTELMIKAASEKDPIERMKLVSTFLLGGIHLNLLDCKAKAPLNPILGETFQAVNKSGCKIYLEQTCHHPPTSNLYMIGPEKSFEIFGFSITIAKLGGMNSIKGWREGKNLIKFKDGTIMTYATPELRVDNLIMGERTIHYAGNFVIKDYQNKIESNTTLSYKDIGNLEGISNKITGLFKSTPEIIPSDHFTTKITKLNKQTKEKALVCEGHGSLFGQIYMDGKKYWSFDDPYESWEQNQEIFLLESDSFKRGDYKCLLKPDYAEAQKIKDQLENIQRKDRYLRENYNKKK